MKRYAVIVAGGSGTRMGGGIPKQFRSLAGRPVLWWSIKAFHDENPDTSIIIVLPKDFIGLWKDFYSTLPDADRFPYKIATGGKTRTESVRNGLALIPDGEDALVAVHDGARPLVTRSVIATGWENAEKHGAAIPVVSVTDSLRIKKETGTETVDRSLYLAVQTPQVFDAPTLKKAYEEAEKSGLSFTDDASVMEHAGKKIAVFDGNSANIKITNPIDMSIAEVILGGMNKN